MATTNLPQYDEDTIDPHGRRIHAFFTNPEKGEASPSLVAEMIRYVIEGTDARLRFPVGPDALPFLGWRFSVSDEDWVGLGGLKDDADYFQRVFSDTGVDLRRMWIRLFECLRQLPAAQPGAAAGVAQRVPIDLWQSLALSLRCFSDRRRSVPRS
jgi:hypothetical protein